MIIDRKLKWDHLQSLSSCDYICGHCGSSLASEHGWMATGGTKTAAYIYICHRCKQPTYFYIPDAIQVPGPAFGNPVANITDNSVELLYEEARGCTKSNAFTASVLCCRKLLMNIAVTKGAEPGKSFKCYIEFLDNKGFIPPDGKEWVDHIRSKGNEATHEIAIIERDDAEELLSFVEMLLKFIFEFPGRMKQKLKEKETENG